MSSLDFLKTIMDLGFDYLKDHSDSTISMQGFADFVHAKSSDDLSEIMAAPQNKVQLNTQKDDLGIYLVLLYRYAKEYVKVALRDSPLSTPDEFSFLITLYPNTSRTKTELINEMVLNKTSGMEVIKSLLNKDLIREYEDPEDKRKVPRIRPAG